LVAKFQNVVLKNIELEIYDTRRRCARGLFALTNKGHARARGPATLIPDKPISPNRETLMPFII
jgi:hypothetical protein